MNWREYFITPKRGTPREEWRDFLEGLPWILLLVFGSILLAFMLMGGC